MRGDGVIVPVMGLVLAAMPPGVASGSGPGLGVAGSRPAASPAVGFEENRG